MLKEAMGKELTVKIVRNFNASTLKNEVREFLKKTSLKK